MAKRCKSSEPGEQPETASSNNVIMKLFSKFRKRSVDTRTETEQAGYRADQAHSKMQSFCGIGGSGIGGIGGGGGGIGGKKHSIAAPLFLSKPEEEKLAALRRESILMTRRDSFKYPVLPPLAEARSVKQKWIILLAKAKNGIENIPRSFITNIDPNDDTNNNAGAHARHTTEPTHPLHGLHHHHHHHHSTPTASVAFVAGASAATKDQGKLALLSPLGIISDSVSGSSSQQRLNASAHHLDLMTGASGVATATGGASASAAAMMSSELSDEFLERNPRHMLAMLIECRQELRAQIDKTNSKISKIDRKINDLLQSFAIMEQHQKHQQQQQQHQQQQQQQQQQHLFESQASRAHYNFDASCSFAMNSNLHFTHLPTGKSSNTTSRQQQGGSSQFNAINETIREAIDYNDNVKVENETSKQQQQYQHQHKHRQSSSSSAAAAAAIPTSVSNSAISSSNNNNNKATKQLKPTSSLLPPSSSNNELWVSSTSPAPQHSHHHARREHHSGAKRSSSKTSAGGGGGGKSPSSRTQTPAGVRPSDLAAQNASAVSHAVVGATALLQSSMSNIAKASSSAALASNTNLDAIRSATELQPLQPSGSGTRALKTSSSSSSRKTAAATTAASASVGERKTKKKFNHDEYYEDEYRPLRKDE